MAFKTDDTRFGQIDSLLTCSICLETLNDPRTLPCFHSFCKYCLETFVKSQRDKALAASKKMEEFHCPACRSIFRLKSNEEVAEMSCTHFIRNMLDVLFIQRQGKSAKCSTNQCDEFAIARCMICELFMCPTCLKFHENWPAFKKHTVLSISELTEGPSEGQVKFKGKSNCKKHKNKTLKFYCETCKELVCRYCMDFNHVKQNHPCLLADDVANDKRQALKTSSEILEEKIKEGSAALQAVSNARSNVTQRLQEDFNKEKDKVNQHKQEILQRFTVVLNEKAKDMVEELELKYNEEYASLENQTTEVTSYLEKLKISNNLSKNLLESGNEEDIISLQEMITEQVEKTLKFESPQLIKPVHNSRIQYKRNPIKNESFTKIFGGKLGKLVSTLCGDSKILKGEHKYRRQLEEWLDDLCNWRLCYRATKDGWSAKDFHRCCDNKGPTMTLVKVRDNIFGGYTDKDWEESGAKRSTSSFLFSLQNKDNLPPFKAPVFHTSKVAVYSSPGCGPAFGSGYDLYICDNPHVNRHSYTQFGGTYKTPLGYGFGYERTNSLLAGSFKFTTDEIEVFY